jgi:ferritin-like metal-binding protein YciE
MDAAIIGAAQKVEHYEMAGYGTVQAFAKLLGENDQVYLLEQTLQEEKQTDEMLSELSREINPRAMEEEDRTPAASHEGRSTSNGKKVA